MKFHLQAPTANVVTGFGEGWVRIGADEYRAGVVILPDRIIGGWAPAGFDALLAEDFARLLAPEPEIVLLGTGARQRFPHPRLLAPLIEARIGVEVMDTRAACRTFNILVAEGRRVAAALAIESA
ncbi:MAG TPA: Mth938-like domain-containing protein [Casimicrobiaceae bacterium]|nr:Mth938-like domain-containing protein [Casimicrobiaceae bacterium]